MTCKMSNRSLLPYRADGYRHRRKTIGKGIRKKRLVEHKRYQQRQSASASVSVSSLSKSSSSRVPSVIVSRVPGRRSSNNNNSKKQKGRRSSCYSSSRRRYVDDGDDDFEYDEEESDDDYMSVGTDASSSNDDDDDDDSMISSSSSSSSSNSSSEDEDDSMDDDDDDDDDESLVPPSPTPPPREVQAPAPNPALAMDDCDSSSDESDTDDEEVMMWAVKMFGITPPPSIAHKKMQSPTSPPSSPMATSTNTIVTADTKTDDSSLLPYSSKPRDSLTAQPHQQQQAPMITDNSDNNKAEPPAMTTATTKPTTKKPKKKNKKKNRRLPVVDMEQFRKEQQVERRKKESAKPLTAAQIQAILAEDELDRRPMPTDWVRRSVRQPSRSFLDSPQMKSFLRKVRNNDPEVVVLKMKKYINDPAAPQAVLDVALDALEENTNCQALYIQNFNEGMQDKQVLHLLKILQQPTCNIWNLNIGETYKVKTKTWGKFAKGLKKTKVTHMYASEHTITAELKEEIRDTIRRNRTKHTMHIDPDNLDVIVQCTHCWWNPINAKVLRPYLSRRGYDHILRDAEAQGLRGSTSEAPHK